MNWYLLLLLPPLPEVPHPRQTPLNLIHLWNRNVLLKVFLYFSISDSVSISHPFHIVQLSLYHFIKLSAHAEQKFPFIIIPFQSSTSLTNMFTVFPFWSLLILYQGARNTRRQSARIFEQFTNFEKPKCFFPSLSALYHGREIQTASPEVYTINVRTVDQLWETNMFTKFLFLSLLTLYSKLCRGWWIKAWVLPTSSSPNLAYNVVKNSSKKF